VVVPERTLTFRFSDVVGSSALWDDHPTAMAEAVPQHDALITDVVTGRGGKVFKTIGDSVCAVFDTASAAVAAAVDAQQRLRARQWSGGIEIAVRMGLHTGVAQRHIVAACLHALDDLATTNHR
jgi:class 3 adenylate cyclase